MLHDRASVTATQKGISVHYLNIDGADLTMFIGPLEAAILRAVWDQRSNTRAIFEYVRDTYTPTKTTELAFTSITSTIDRLYRRGLLLRSGDRSQYTYSPAIASEEEFTTQAVARVMLALINQYPREVGLTLKKGNGNGK